jgi:hypothetical protein
VIMMLDRSSIDTRDVREQGGRHPCGKGCLLRRQCAGAVTWIGAGELSWRRRPRPA